LRYRSSIAVAAHESATAAASSLTWRDSSLR
jgi:hypothetical protein